MAYDTTLLEMLRACSPKRAFVDTTLVDPAAAGGGMPPGGMPPGGMPPGGMPPGMDPAAMGGGMPPGMDPAMMGGGMPPGMDPAMMGGGMPPGMDPAMMGAAPPQGAPPAAPPPPADGGAQAPLTADTVRQIVQEALAAGGAGGKPKEKKVDPAAAISAMQADLQQTKMLLAHICSSMQLPIDPLQLLQTTAPAAEGDESSGGGSEGGGGGGEAAKTAADCGYQGYGVPVDMNAVMTASLRGTLGGGIDDLAQKAGAIADILRAQRRVTTRTA